MAEKANSSATTAEVLKNFAQNVTTSSTKVRVTLCSDVEQCLCNTQDMPDAAIKGILKVLLLTVGKYRDGKSGRAVKKLVHTLAEKYLVPTVKIISPVLMSFAESFTKPGAPCRSSSGDALFALTWTCIILKEAVKREDPNLKDAINQMISIQNYLIYGALAARNLVIQKATFRKMKAVWSKDVKTIEDHANRLTEIEPAVHSICSISLLMRYFTEKKLSDCIERFKPKFLELYVKQVIQSRSKPEVHVLECGKELLRHCSHAEFKDLLLPAAQKSMLRNPEIILQAVGYMIRDIQLDLSSYVLDLGKPLAAQLLSKNSTARTESADAVKNLTRQCSDPGAVENFVVHLFGVFNGSEGKLTSVEQKLCVLLAIGNMSHHTVSGSGSIQNLSASVSELFIPVLQQEVHEGTLIHALQMLSQWCNKFYTQVPDKLIQWYKTGIGLKTSSSAVRNAYIQCMNSSFHGDTLTRSTDVMSVLLQSLEKAKNQPTQTQLVTEALSASCILVKLSLVDIQAEAKLGNFWNIVLDNNKHIFTNDKFLYSASDEALQSLVTLSERIILDHPHRLSDNISKQFYKSLVFCLTRRSWNVRKRASSSVKRLVSMLGGSKIALCLIEEFKLLLQDQKLVDPLTLAVESDKEVQSQEANKNIEPSILSQSLLSVCSVEKVELRDAEEIALASLVPAHHSCVVFANRDTWTDILFRIQVDPKKFVDKSLEKCSKFINMSQPLDDDFKSIISTLVRISPTKVLPFVLQHIKDLLTKPDLVQITQDEFGIYQTPEGVPYDQKIIENAKRQDVEDKNIKKQNKMYSYDMQVDEIKSKKDKEKKQGQVKLTKTQEEQLEIQLKKESAIRDRLKELNLLIQCGCDLLEASLQGDPHSTCEHMVEICEIMVPLLQSPLAAPQTSKTLIKIGQAAFPDKIVGSVISNVTIRVLQPVCELDSNWSKESLDKQTGRAINILADASLPHEETESKLFSASTFAFIFYFLNVILLKGSVIVGNNQSVLHSALQLIIEHAQMRQQDTAEDGNQEQYNPEMLPRKQMLKLLLQVIGTNVGKMQQLATVALIEVTKSLASKDGYARDEIFVLLDSLTSSSTAVREASLRSLSLLSNVLPNIDDDNEVGLKIAHRVTVACYDSEDDVKKIAVCLREDLDIEEPYSELCMLFVDDVVHSEESVRKATSMALADAVKYHPEYLPAILQSLLDLYEENLYVPPPKLDEFGRVIGEQVPDKWEARSGIALALGKLSPHISQDQILTVFEFYVPKALGDRNNEVRTNMRDSALTTITEHGKANVTVLLPLFEKFMLTAPDSANYDAVRQSIVILMGSLAKHLDKDNPKVKPIVAQLIAALSTPSQEVQDAVANCLPPLVPAIKDGAPELVQKLLHLLLESDTYGERKGAAYGLAGLVKGLGIVSLKQLEINTTLQDAIQDKKNPRRREGALFAYEMFCLMLGRLFEPYIVHILPSLLLCFGDSSQYVREAADDTAKAVMSKLSAPGVKQVLPSLLRALEEDSWRTKTGSVELLGAMAFCAPKQLSQCLPSIVPKLIEVLTDSHVKVQKAGGQALKQIGSVIRNPEIQAIVPILLDALQDPSKKTTVSLQSLLETKFVHFIDAPSLALIMPVVERAFQDRATETRKMAAQIIGNMYALTDQKDLSPYLPSVLPGLQQCLLDPVPEVRTVSARALGAMVKGMGESIFDDLLPWLMKTLVSEVSSVDRSGAAQGLSEVIGGMGLEKLEKLMPDIIQTAERTELPPHVRDGYTMMYIFLPTVFGRVFVKYISAIIPSVLKGLADESEYVRETALKAGQRIITLYADSAIELLLPELEKGLFDENWRIRYSSVQLLGDLLYNISGVSGKMTTETAHDDDNFGTETSQQAIFKTLGKERRNRVLAGLYMGRSDTALLVRQSALHVWKVIVSNTPRTLREILPTLFKLLLGCLASTSHDKRQVAGRTLGDLVKKLGERVLPEIIPILESGLDSPHSDQRQGVCIGLSEIMEATSREHVSVFADSLIPTVRRALCDPLPEVRLCASKTFDNLHANIGSRALDEILPDLLKKLAKEETSEQALDGLRQVMSFKSRVVLPYLIPQLTAKPVNTKALSLLSSVAGDSLINHLSKILPALLTALSEKSGTPDEEQELEYCKKVVLSVETEAGVHSVVSDLLAATKNSPPNRCYAAVQILHAFCRQTKSDYSDHIPQLFQGLISLFSSSDDRILHASWDCLDAVTKKLDPTEILQHISHVRQAVRFVKSDFKGKELPGFSLPKKGIAPILPIFREGILNGSQDMKESAANGLGDVINLTSAEALKPSVVNITGPLIRILGDRFVWSVKVAVLQTLTLLLGKVGAMLKPFLPQLQTTFIKALNDPNRTVRLRAADALGKLIVIHVRVDPLFTELHNLIKTTEDTSMRDTTLQALRGCLIGAGTKMSEAIRKQFVVTLIGLINSSEDTTRMTAAGCLGACCTCLPDEQLADLLINTILDTDVPDWVLRHGRGVSLSVALKEAPEKLLSAEFRLGVMKTIESLVSADRIPICLSGYRSIFYLLQHQLACAENLNPDMISRITKAMKHDSNEVKQLAALIVLKLADYKPEPLKPEIIRLFIPMLVNGTKEKNTLVKSNSEYGLIALLQLRSSDSVLQNVISLLDQGMKDSLNDVISKSLKKLAAQQQQPLKEEIDDTLIK